MVNKHSRTNLCEDCRGVWPLGLSGNTVTFSTRKGQWKKQYFHLEDVNIGQSVFRHRVVHSISSTKHRRICSKNAKRTEMKMCEIDCVKNAQRRKSYRQIAECNTVIFSDESKFNVFGSDDQRYVWKKLNKEMDIHNLQPTVKHGGGSVMVWGFMAANSARNLIFIDDIAIITETWLTPSDKIRLRNYNIYRKDGIPTNQNKPREGVLIATQKNIPVEDTPQQTTSSIDTIQLKLKITPPLTIGTAYAPPKTRITTTDLDHIIPPHQAGHFIIGDTKIHKIITNAKNKAWQDKLANIKCTDNTLWTTYTGGSKAKISVLQDTALNQQLYTDEEKVEGLAQNFHDIHMAAYTQYSPLEKLVNPYFPSSWKVAKIIPVPKPGKPGSDISSYRPISLLDIFGKILEKIIQHQIQKHIQKLSIIIPQQFDFRSEHSAIHQLQRVTEHIIMEKNKNHTTQLILLDLNKAFDSVWHKALLSKLQDIKLPPNLINMIRSCLRNRKFYVTINGNKSTHKQIAAGVPQRSILGPLLTIYINDIPHTDKTHLAIFADDIAIYASSWSSTQATKYIQNHIDKLQEYFTNWKLKINSIKTQAIAFSNKRNKTLDTIKITGHNISWTHAAKYLGIILDQNHVGTFSSKKS
ncbi:uncharacterized protein LOC122526809 [Frieseomelitta varia]|uniref:uncharacterized protein LOC122526809 n=1 Tax=Frieseomelitta varia TaxID=561572 RepID=UPI001CB69612|nr:uncharacterized protein LOC122526809 [Frieseomelitta varia]